MANCNIYILSCPIGAVGDECTFEIDCCSGQLINYTMQPDTIVEACVLEEGVVTVTSISGSAFDTTDPCTSDCGDIPAAPTATPRPTATVTPTPTPTPTPGAPTPTPTPSPSPSPTPTPISVQCYEWTLVCPSGGSGCSYQYIDCDAVTQTGTLAPDQDVDVCVLFPNTPQVTNGTAIETGIACVPGPTPTPGPPTPTPTPSTGCTEWTLMCPSGATTCNYYYTDCDNVVQNGILGSDQDVDVCVKDGTTPTVQNGSAQNQNVGCFSTTPTPTPTPTPGPPTPTPTPGVPTATPTATPTPTPTPTTPTPTSVVPPIPSPVETEYTLTYSQTSKGWPSFYSYIPDYMLGMNQYFYTFKGGNLYQHNANGNRNNFYGDQYNSQITTVFNQNPLDNKIFKTINLESDQAWQANLETDMQQNGFIDSTWFIEKEGSYFAYVRQNGEVPALSGQYAMRSANGIGKCISNSTVGNTTTINFSTNPLVNIGSIVSVGDYLYFSLPSYTTISLGGQITSINVDIPTGINQILIDTSISGTSTITIQDPYILYIKNSEAESHGLLGHYCIFTLINESSLATELFAVESEVMKSYP